MKLAVVVQRYGADISGGAELHARYIAERLARHAEVTVFATCAHDYVNWRNELPEGRDVVNGVRVERFRVAHDRDLADFDRRSGIVFGQRHSLRDELAWLESQGPASPALIAHLRRVAHTFDYVLLFSMRYYPAYYGARAAADRAVLVPTAERDPSIALGIFAPVFRGARAVMYNSFEERALINAITANHEVPGIVVGIGSNIPETASGERARQKFALANPYIVYVGRIDENKGCAELFAFFTKYSDAAAKALDLVLIGTPVMPIPQHPRIRHLGHVDDQDKFDTMAGARALVMPSYYESLSMVTLESWALGRPVLANAKCDVLLGQCLRSNAGLYYEDAEEFSAALEVLLMNDSLTETLGRNGRAYFTRHYSWPVIERKYLEMFARLSAERTARRIDPLPGWLTLRRRDVSAAADILATVPSGPARV